MCLNHNLNQLHSTLQLKNDSEFIFTAHFTEMPSSKRISLLMPDTEFGQFSQIRQLNLQKKRKYKSSEQLNHQNYFFFFFFTIYEGVLKKNK